MTAPLQTWKVLPHGRPTLIGGNMLTVTGYIQMPLMELPRRMTVVRLHDARLVVYSAIALDEDEMIALEVWGRPTFLVVPSDKHRLDAKIWKDRYPTMQVVTPRGARAKVEELLKVDTVAPDFKPRWPPQTAPLMATQTAPGRTAKLSTLWPVWF